MRSALLLLLPLALLGQEIGSRCSETIPDCEWQWRAGHKVCLSTLQKCRKILDSYLSVKSPNEFIWFPGVLFQGKDFKCVTVDRKRRWDVFQSREIFCTRIETSGNITKCTDQCNCLWYNRRVYDKSFLVKDIPSYDPPHPILNGVFILKQRKIPGCLKGFETA